MSKPIDDFCEFIVGDVLGHVPYITSKKMFGGYGLYYHGAIFALLISDTELCFKVNKSNQKRYEALGSSPFIYTGHTNKKPTQMPYWYVPEELYDDRELLEEMVLESARISNPKL